MPGPAPRDDDNRLQYHWRSRERSVATMPAITNGTAVSLASFTKSAMSFAGSVRLALHPHGYFASSAPRPMRGGK
jgi:hypothetical protein